MLSMPRKIQPSSSGVKFAVNKIAKNRLKKARAMAREKAHLRELRHIAMFMAEEIAECAPTRPTTPDPEETDHEEDEFWDWNWDIYYECRDHFVERVKWIYVCNYE